MLVVGPSGAGKDSLIAGAAVLLRGEPRLVFARRLITRPAAAGGEGHLALSPDEFAEWRDSDRLMLHWHAHGFDYGLPQELAMRLRQGRSVVANVSRGVVADARRRFAPTAIVAVTATPDTLAARLAGRGRETVSEIRLRLDRAGTLAPEHVDHIIDNDGALDPAVDRFVALLRDFAGYPAR